MCADCLVSHEAVQWDQQASLLSCQYWGWQAHQPANLSQQQVETHLLPASSACDDQLLQMQSAVIILLVG